LTKHQKKKSGVKAPLCAEIRMVLHLATAANRAHPGYF
jgi:hypothetical protein